MTLTIQFNLASERPAYRQIADAIRVHLVSGALKPSDPLPTVRELALDLGVHFNTVAEAYRILADEGWLDLKRRRGAVVLPRQPAEADSNGWDCGGFQQELRELNARAQSQGATREQLVEALRTAVEELKQ